LDALWRFGGRESRKGLIGDAQDANARGQSLDAGVFGEDNSEYVAIRAHRLIEQVRTFGKREPGLGQSALVRGLADFLDQFIARAYAGIFVANEIGHESSTMFLTANRGSEIQTPA
jgi:hypothetical protein